MVQFFKYFVSGGFAACVWLFTLWFLVSQFGLLEELASFLGLLLATVINYNLQHKYVFKVEGKHRIYFKRFLIINIITQILNMILFWISINILDIQYLIAQTIIIGLIFILNFLLNKLYTFKKV